MNEALREQFKADTATIMSTDALYPDLADQDPFPDVLARAVVAAAATFLSGHYGRR